jgi:hypothetical protein
MTITLQPRDDVAPPAVQVTQDMVRLYARGKAVKAAGAHDTWEEDGGRKWEFIDVTRDLMRRLGMWQPWRGYLNGPLDDLDPPCPPDHPCYDDWLEAVQARDALEAALPKVVK